MLRLTLTQVNTVDYSQLLKLNILLTYRFDGFRILA